LDTISDVNNKGILNVLFSVQGLFKAPAPLKPTPDGFHLSGFCDLFGQGKSNAAVTLDYDKETRADKPTIGPDECQ
jgi:hypothetical protein